MIGDFKLICGDSTNELKKLEENSIDAIVTDPPYGLTSITKRFGKENSAPAKEGKDGSFARLSRGFMGKLWDGTGIEYNVDFWKECLKVLKPGGYLLAFGGTRTFHRIACAIEDAGFEIRDTLMWLFGSGFPKSHNIGLDVDKKLGVESKVVGEGKSGQTSRAYQSEETTTAGTYELKIAQNKFAGYGTALKPAYEPIIMARKPIENTVADNMLKYGVGGLNIDECRVKFGKETDNRVGTNAVNTSHNGFWNKDWSNGSIQMYKDNGRFPANIITDGSLNSLEESRYFYCAKASTKDRDEGLEDFDLISTGELQGGRKEGSAGSIMKSTDGSTRVNPYAGAGTVKRNTHPTVKPTELMQYLVRLVAPKGSTILDPFNGSGSTGKAVAYENLERNANYKYIGIDLSQEYIDISTARINYVLKNYNDLCEVNGEKSSLSQETNKVGTLEKLW